MLECQKNHFSIPEELHYLNCAYMSPLLKSVEEAGKHAMQLKRNPTAIKPVDFYTNCTELRKEFAKLINVERHEQIAIIPSASYGLANAANNIPFQKGDEIIISGEQFPSNVYVWMEKAKEYNLKLISVKAPDYDEDRGRLWNERLLEAITDKTKVVALGHVHWTDGTLFDLSNIGRKVREVGGYLIVDGTQSIGALPFNSKEIKPDAVIVGGYKWLLGSYGLGLGYYSERFDHGIPFEHNWISRIDSEDFAGLVNYKDQFQPGAQRYDMGERSNFILVDMLLAALKQVNQWGADSIQEYASRLSKDALSELENDGFIVEDPKWRGAHLLGVKLKESQDPVAVAQQLVDNQVHVSVRGSALRVSIHLYNDAQDLRALSDTLRGL